LVRPREGWPNDQATAAASGADAVLAATRVFATTEAAIADLHTVYAATARPRDMTKEVISPRQAAERLRRISAGGERVGVLFGRESKGLDNDDVARADAVLTVPLNPAFSSLNLAQAVFALGYEWRMATETVPAAGLVVPKHTRPANKAELLSLLTHLETALEGRGFFHVREKKPIMLRNIRNAIQRSHMTEQEVRTFRGIITALGRKRRSP
jgi:tRNA/rRNA methyltransferase